MINKVTTSSVHCSELIDQGVLHLYNFNHEHAILQFKKALTFDENCPMAHFFIAYCNAGHYNNIDGLNYAEGWDESQIALKMTHNLSLSDWEKALINAQVERFCSPIGSIPKETMNGKYAIAMRLVHNKFGENVEVATFFAESLMNLAPWKIWTSPPDIKPALPETTELVTVLEKALVIAPTHPGLCHFYIHTMELSAKPELALPAADTLRQSVKDLGHLIHMPSHIDIWVGHYNEAIEMNKRAIEADEKYILTKDEKNDFYKVYRMHNYQFLVWSAMFNGQFSLAIEYANAVRLQLKPQDLTYKLGETPIGLIYLEPLASIHWHVLVRFGKWEEIINIPLTEDKEIYPTSEAFARYARGVAFSALKRPAEADAERDLFYKALQDKSLSKRYLVNNVVYDPEQPGKGILDVAEAVMNGEIEYHRGNFEEAFNHLRLAVKRDCSLIYDEPWSWMMPTRHVLGALLLEHGDLVEAEAVYREDLSQYKDNMWSLFGLHQVLKQQHKLEEAESVFSKFKQASAFADIKIGASCLCATKLCC